MKRSYIFIGDEPSKFNKDSNIPFIGAKCYPRLLKWIEELGVSMRDIELHNSHKAQDLYFLCNRAAYFNYRIVALGNKASKRLSQLKIPHFKLPHPSGLNRQINNKQYIVSKLDECKKYLKNNSYYP